MVGFKKATISLICILLCFTLTSCWNYEDVEEQFVVMGMAIDKDEQTDEYVIHAEISKAKGGSEAELTTRIECAQGTTIYDANRNLISKIGSKVYWGHAMIFIVSEKVAKDGIADVIGFLRRQTQVKSNILIFVTGDEDITKIFEFEDPIHEDVSQHLQDLLEDYEASGKYRQTPLFITLQELASDEVSLVLTHIKMQEVEQSDNEQEKPTESQEKTSTSEEKPNEIIVTDGMAVFSEDKMVGKLSDIETRSALLLKNELSRNYILTIKENNDIPNCTIEVINTSLDVKPREDEEGNLILNIQLDIEGDLVEMHSLEDYISADQKSELELEFMLLLTKELEQVIDKTRNTFEVDIFDFAGITHRKLHDYYINIDSDWIDVYKEAEIDVAVDLRIKSSSLTKIPVKVGK